MLELVDPNLSTCAAEVLLRGLHGSVPACDVDWIARTTGRARSADEVARVSLSIVAELLEARCVDVGATEGGRFVRWRSSVGEILARIERERSQPRDVQQILLRHTDLGDGVAHRLRH